MLEIYLPKRNLGIRKEIKVHDHLGDLISIDVCSITVEGQDYIACENAAKNYASSQKTGIYGSGLANNGDLKVERTGLLGEMALGIYTGLGVNLGFQAGGDAGYDFIFKGKIRGDIKTATALPYYFSRGSVQYYESMYFIVNGDLKSDIYLAAYVEKESTEEKRAIINLVGGQFRDKILEERNIKPARKREGTHQNYEVDYCKLIPIHQLYRVVQEKLISF